MTKQVQELERRIIEAVATQLAKSLVWCNRQLRSTAFRATQDFFEGRAYGIDDFLHALVRCHGLVFEKIPARIRSNTRSVLNKHSVLKPFSAWLDRKANWEKVALSFRDSYLSRLESM